MYVDLQDVLNKGLRRSPSDAADAAFHELAFKDAQEQLHKELDRLIKTGRPEQMTVSLHGIVPNL